MGCQEKGVCAGTYLVLSFVIKKKSSGHETLPWVYILMIRIVHNGMTCLRTCIFLSFILIRVNFIIRLSI